MAENRSSSPLAKIKPKSRQMTPSSGKLHPPKFGIKLDSSVQGQVQQGAHLVSKRCQNSLKMLLFTRLGLLAGL